MGSFGDIISCLIVSAFWGITNPLIKKSTRRANCPRGKPVVQIIGELSSLIQNRKYIVLFLINQSGSVIFYLTLKNADLSLVVPVANALTLIFTGIIGIILGEKKPDCKALLGTFFILMGICCCILEKEAS